VKSKKICVWSGKRGGFGALTPTMRAIQAHEALELALVVTDQHLYDQFGRTVREVEDQFPVAAAIDMEQSGDSNEERARAVGLCLQRSVDVLADLAPDVLLVIGDRGEVFAACIAAHNMRIAIAHVQGGDLSGTYKGDTKSLGACPLHLSTYDLTRHGILISGQAYQSLPQVLLELDGDDIYAVGVFGLIFGRYDNLQG